MTVIEPLTGNWETSQLKPIGNAGKAYALKPPAKLDQEEKRVNESPRASCWESLVILATTSVPLKPRMPEPIIWSLAVAPPVLVMRRKLVEPGFKTIPPKVDS